MKKCKQGYYYCNTSKKCKKIPKGHHVMPSGYLMRDSEHEEEGKKKNGNGNGNGNANNSNGNGNGNGGSNGGSGNGGGGGVSEAWSARYKRSIDCDNPKGFSQKAHCRGRKKVNEEAVSKKQQKFFGIVRAIQKGEIKATTPETAKAAATMKKDDVKDFASTKHKGLPDKKDLPEESNPRIPRKKGQPANSKKHSDLYTDENPKGTIHGLGFKDVATAKASVSKIRNSSRSHAHKIQAAVAMEQRAREMGKTAEAAVYRKFINSMKKKTKAMNEAKNGDHEIAMAQSQLSKSAKNIAKLKKALGKKEKDIPAWMQAKITDTAHDTDAAASYADKMNEGTLHKWFSGSKSKDGKGGWVNVTTGGTCASDKPGEGVPKCVSRSKYDSMTPAERKSASRRKKAADPGQQQKTGAAKPTYVATDKPKKKTMNASYSNWRAELEQLDEFLGGKPGDGYIGHPNLDIKNPLAKKQKKAPVLPGSKGGGLFNRVGAQMGDVRMRQNQATQNMRNSYEPEGELVDEGKEKKETPKNDKVKMIAKELDAAVKMHTSQAKRLRDAGICEAKDKKGKGSGTKDACYHKVKSRYSVWPSAYASGALVKCRKVGAANWGNSTKKEEFELGESKKDKLKEISKQLAGASKMHAQQSKKVASVADAIEEAKKCWPGYEKKGTKKMFGKTYNNCVKKEGFSNWRDDFIPTDYETTNLITNEDVLGEDWQKSNRKDGVDGMSQKSVDAYKRENPGSKLQTAVTEKNPTGSRAKRRTSFCARSKGQKDMHNIDCTKTPDKKICKARKRWNC